tara:strand:+ start:3134 stop:3400 length:267 start_codon:yes stop_codon:yes gene_type:complete
MNHKQGIADAQKAIAHLINNCLANFSVEQLEVVKARHNILMQQQMFWVMQDNMERFYYDLKEYGVWLCDYIADIERSNGGEKEWENYS